MTRLQKKYIFTQVQVKFECQNYYLLALKLNVHAQGWNDSFTISHDL